MIKIKAKLIGILLISIMLLNNNLYAGLIQPSSQELQISRENLRKDKSTEKYIAAVDKIVETYSSNKIFLRKLSYQILRAQAKLTSKPIRTNRQRQVLMILSYLDIQVSLALYKISKTN